MTVSFRPSRFPVLLLFFLVLFLGAMILGPLLYFALQEIFPVPFHRCMDRALLFSALGALAVAWPRVHLQAWWPLNAMAWKQALLGLAIALVAAQAILGFDAAFGGLGWTPITTHEKTRILLTALLAALLVPLAEETIFRGFIQTELVRGLGARTGVVLGALIFMIAHFIKIPVELDHEPVHLWSGATAIGAAFLPLVHGDFLNGRGLNLFLLGLILGGVFLRWGALWLNYGLHAGFILTLLIITGFTRAPATGFFDVDLLSNPLTSAGLILLGFWLWRYYRRHWPELETGANAP